jgi:hypothetical protein
MKHHYWHIRRIPFILCTIALHLIALWWSWQHVSGEGLASHTDSKGSGASVLNIHFVQHQHTPPQTAKSSVSPDAGSRFPEPAVITSPMSETDLLPVGYETTQPTEDTRESVEYVSSGRLTRLPTPLEDIDLDLPDISGIAANGMVEMTLFIDSSGSVADVLALADTEDLRLFSNLVAERFRKARFAPGEINGRPVKSQLKITVVSESPTEAVTQAVN